MALCYMQLSRKLWAYNRLSDHIFHCKTNIFKSLLSTEANRPEDNQNAISQRRTHFGFYDVTEEEKEKRVYNVFHNVAEKYDLMNDAMSGGIHRLWKDYYVRKLYPVDGMKVLDSAGGTGDIALRIVEFIANQRQSDNLRIEINLPPIANDINIESSTVSQRSSVTVCDINQAMLDVGKRKAERLGYSSEIVWTCGSAEKLPFKDSTFDAYTIAFGIRNCTHIETVLDEAYRVLSPGGRFMCLEFSAVENKLLRRLYDGYSFQVIPVLGQILAGDWTSYQYLVESIRQFPDQIEFCEMIRDAGFSAVRYENLFNGVAAIHSGFKLTNH